MSKAKKAIKKVAKKVVKRTTKSKAKKDKVLTGEQEARIAKALENPKKLKDKDLRKIIQTSKLHFKEANRILEGRKAEKKLNKKLRA